MNKKEANTSAFHDLPHEHLTFGQRAADRLTSFCGSWMFILILVIVIAGWVFLNVMMVLYKWDPYPFIVLNLLLSCVAALEAPIILLSQNRTTERDRLQARYDYLINRKAAKNIEELHKKIDKLQKALTKQKKR